MNRPQKNKINNPTLPEDQQNKVDERNFVDLEASEEISVEDRINMYWMENKSFVSGCIFLIALLSIGFNGMRMYTSKVEAQLQSAYAEAVAKETIADFAKDNSNKELGGFAALTVADQAYSAEEFEKALKFYVIASNALATNFLAGRSLLGQAFANFYMGNEEVALTQLANIATNGNLAEVARAEAAYHLAIEAHSADRREEYERYIAQIQASPIATQWQQRVAMYEQQVR